MFAGFLVLAVMIRCATLCWMASSHRVEAESPLILVPFIFWNLILGLFFSAALVGGLWWLGHFWLAGIKVIVPCIAVYVAYKSTFPMLSPVQRMTSDDKELPNKPMEAQEWRGMTDEQRWEARAALIGGLSVRGLIADLGGKRYADLVTKHMREIEGSLPSTIAIHEGLILPEESDEAQEILENVAVEAMRPDFWAVDAGDFLSSVSCHFNDALSPTSVDDAGIFNLFQLITMTLADRARLDVDFRHNLEEPPQASDVPSPEHGTITRMLGIAINDCDAGRISRRQLLSIFQDSIDNGDILEEENHQYVIANVLPLVVAGLLQPSEHLRKFEDLMNKTAATFLVERGSQQGGRSERDRWW